MADEPDMLTPKHVTETTDPRRSDAEAQGYRLPKGHRAAAPCFCTGACFGGRLCPRAV